MTNPIGTTAENVGSVCDGSLESKSKFSGMSGWFSICEELGIFDDATVASVPPPPHP